MRCSMALDKNGLKSALQSIFEDLSNKSAATVAQQMADAIDTYVKTAEVVPGIPVSGTCPQGPVTGQTSGPGSLI